jgi:hypothetical protein
LVGRRASAGLDVPVRRSTRANDARSHPRTSGHRRDLRRLRRRPARGIRRGYDESRLAWIEERADAAERFREALQRVWVWSLPPEILARVERAAGAPLPLPDADVKLEIVRGKLPGTIQIMRNDVVADEWEVEPEEVDSMIELLREQMAHSRNRQSPRGE